MNTRKGAARRARAKRSEPAKPELAPIEPPEEGLSVDPEELGASFLRYATEQGNFEGARAVPLEFAPPAGPASDDAPREPSGATGNLWDRTVAAAIADEPVRDSGEVDLQQLEPEEGKPEEPARGVVQIDLNANVIEEGTLLDAEGEELGEVIPADPATDDERTDAEAPDGVARGVDG